MSLDRHHRIMTGTCGRDVARTGSIHHIAARAATTPFSGRRAGRSPVCSTLRLFTDQNRLPKQKQAHPEFRMRLSIMISIAQAEACSYRASFFPASAPPRSWTPSANSSTIFSLNAGRSLGERLVTSPLSTTTSSSTQLAPAFFRSLCIEG